MNLNVRELLISSNYYSEPSFYVNFHKIVRPSIVVDDFTCKIVKNNRLIYWKIQDDKLIKLVADRAGIFFDAESYLIQWYFDLKVDNTVLEELLVYHWKGQQATKGVSPLPPEIEEHYPVERIVQWSEPAIFFYGVPKRLITLSGQEDAFNPEIPHLLLIQGELLEEIHLCEVPCEKSSLRSRATFLLVVPNQELFLYWHGLQTSQEQRENIKTCQPHNTLIEWQKDWASFSVKDLEEHSETTGFLQSVKGNITDYIRINFKSDFTPKLFYLNSITDSFLATKIEYPLRAKNVIAPFPFLQSHLYTAEEPALFLLDNHREIWLWEGTTDGNSNCDLGIFKKELILAKELVKIYIEEKEKMLSQKISVYHVYCNKEPLEFKNIFPF